MRYAAVICLVVAVYFCGKTESSSHSREDACAKGVGLWRKGMRGYYIECTMGPDGVVTGVLRRCPAGQMMDDQLQKCTATAPNVGGRRVRRQDPPPPPPPADTCKGKFLSCVDCNNVRICAKIAGKFTQVTTEKCTDAQPYCDDSAPGCGKKIPDDCPSKFPCTDVGIFPDPVDCTMFHFCYDDGKGNLLDDPFYCDPNQVFSGAIGDCKAKASTADCHTASCPAGATAIVPFPLEPKYSIFCIAGKPSYIYKCPDFQEFNPTTSECAAVCKGQGKIPDMSDIACKKYFDCAGASPTYKPVPKTCPGPSTNVFIKKTLTCGTGTCPQ